MPGTKRIRPSGRRSPFNIAPLPRIIFVVAYDKDFTIGRGGALPWHLPADLIHFKALTIGKPVVMGRKTFASIGKPLKLRRNIVLTRDPAFAAEGVEAARSVQDVLDLTQGAGEIAVIGGAQVFEEFSSLVNSVYATEIDARVGGDVRFNLPERDAAVTELGMLEPDERNAYPMRFRRYDFTVHPEHVTGGSRNESNPSS